MRNCSACAPSKRCWLRNSSQRAPTGRCCQCRRAHRRVGAVYRGQSPHSTADIQLKIPRMIIRCIISKGFHHAKRSHLVRLERGLAAATRLGWLKSLLKQTCNQNILRQNSYLLRPLPYIQHITVRCESLLQYTPLDVM